MRKEKGQKGEKCVNLISFENNLYYILNCQMSTNRSPIGSRYIRKENYQTINFPSNYQSLSPHHQVYSTHDPSASKKSLQQKQIEDLEQKVDLILEHNDKLVIENSQLKKKLTEVEAVGSSFLQKQRLSRYQMAQENQFTIRKLNSQLSIKTRELQQSLNQFDTYKEITRKENESMRSIISGLTETNETLKSDCTRLSQQLERIREDHEQQINLVTKQAERKTQMDLCSLRKQQEEQLNREKNFQNKLIEQLTQKFQTQRVEWQSRKMVLINKLQQTHNTEINELREQMQGEFDKEIQKIQQKANERCKEERDKADKFIKEFMDTFGPDNSAQADALKLQIKTLQQSLQNRKQFIQELTSGAFGEFELKSNINEMGLMKERLKEQVEHLMRENQLLKIKMAQKYEQDLKEMVRIYEDKIEILSKEARSLSDQNDRLRINYEDEVTNRIRQRRNWEIQVGQLKNLIRKLKVELQGVQDQFRLNIDGIKDQNATFSMALMKSMVQDREKAGFFSQENRKLRYMYEKHQAEVVVEKKQAQQKVKYYESKVQHLKKLMQEQKDDIRRKEQMFERQMAEREQNLRQSINRERQQMKEAMFLEEEEKQELNKALLQTKQQCSEVELDLKEAKSEIDRLLAKIRQNEEHIERLRMELDMQDMDNADKDSNLAHWKEHYEGVIVKLEEDKKELKSMIESQNQKIQQLTYKYRLLEEQLKKAAISLEKRGELDKKVINLGLDQNLIKNMGELWVRDVKGQSS